jgi:ABC-type Fe3+ transport system substrate-binding protein
MKQEFSGSNWQLGKFRWSITDGKKPVNFGLPKNINDLLTIAPDKRNDKQKKTLLDFFRGQDGQVKKLNTTLANAKKPRPIDPNLKMLQDAVARAEKPLPLDPQLTVYKRAQARRPHFTDHYHEAGIQRQ